jgi:uncharacterized membrane protein
MALDDLQSNLQLLFRWLHVIAGITWIGHLYFFNFVNAQFQTKLDAALKKQVNPELLLRALWWFRWGAMITFLMGLVLFTQIYMYTPGRGFGPSASFSIDHHITGRGFWILLGMFFGVSMWANVWFVIWPRQKKILGGLKAGTPHPDAAKMAATATRASKANTYMSGPMLFGMLAPSHYGSINAVTAVVAIALGLVAVWFAYRTSTTAGS